MRIAKREWVVLENEGEQIFGVLHSPLQPLERPAPAVAIFHGLLGSKDQPHQLFVKLADARAEAGLVALRIDFRGRGDSEGDSIEMTPQKDITDARKALDYLEALPHLDAGRFGVLGLSWGGAIAAVVAGDDPCVSRAVLWNAVAEVHHWNPEFKQVDGRDVVELWGNLVGRKFYEGVRHVFPLRDILRARGPVLVVQSTKDEAIAEPVASAERVVQSLRKSGVEADLILLEEADHALMAHAWEQEAIRQTVTWLRHSFGLSG